VERGIVTSLAQTGSAGKPDYPDAARGRVNVEGMLGDVAATAEI